MTRPPNQGRGALAERLTRGLLEIWSHREARLLAAALVPVAAAWVFIEIADEVVEGELDALDRAIVLALRTPGDPADPLGPPWLEEAMRDVTALGGLAVLGLVTATTGGYLWLKRSSGALLLLLSSTAGGVLLSMATKLAFARPRPELVPHTTVAFTPSFPSGHAAMSAIVYLTLAALLARLVAENRLKIYCLGAALLLTTLVGISRVYAGVHYPSDVVAGWALGVSWATLTWLVALALERRGRI